jgi:hypothetical protein
MAETQNLRNHVRVVPAYHYGTSFPLLVFFLWSGYRLVRAFSLDTVVLFLLSIGLLLMFVTIRSQILTVQDRLIRLEMRLRLAQVLPPDLQASIGQLSTKHLVALRFASDSELAALVREVLSGQLTTQKAIKEQIRDWQADYLRA